MDEKNTGPDREPLRKPHARGTDPEDDRLTPDVDAGLSRCGRVVTGDSVILDRCESWFNLASGIIGAFLPGAQVVDFCGEP